MDLISGVTCISRLVWPFALRLYLIIDTAAYFSIVIAVLSFLMMSSIMLNDPSTSGPEKMLSRAFTSFDKTGYGLISIPEIKFYSHQSLSILVHASCTYLVSMSTTSLSTQHCPISRDNFPLSYSSTTFGSASPRPSIPLIIAGLLHFRIKHGQVYQILVFERKFLYMVLGFSLW